MANNSPVKRAVRVAERIRAELMELLLRGAIRDPRAAGATITHVAVTDDLQLARIYVRLIEADPSERRQKELVRAMGGATGFLRRELGTRLSTKYTPDLQFFWDERVDRADRVERILAEIRDEARDAEDAAAETAETAAETEDAG